MVLVFKLGLIDILVGVTDHSLQLKYLLYLPKQSIFKLLSQAFGWLVSLVTQFGLQKLLELILLKTKLDCVLLSWGNTQQDTLALDNQVFREVYSKLFMEHHGSIDAQTYQHQSQIQGLMELAFMRRAAYLNEQVLAAPQFFLDAIGVIWEVLNDVMIEWSLMNPLSFDLFLVWFHIVLHSTITGEFIISFVIFIISEFISHAKCFKRADV